jgi:hypothetical protein
MAAIAARFNALKAMGVLVEVDESNFRELLMKREHPVVIVGEVGVFSKKFVYLMAWDGFVFYCKTKTTLVLPTCDLIHAKSIRLPEL